VTVADDNQTSVEGAARAETSDSTVKLGLVVTPALDEPDVVRLVRDLERVLSKRYPKVSWKITAIRESLVRPPAEVPDLVDAARSRLLDENWDLVVYVTELPLRIGRRPLLRHSSPTHRAAVVSLPALGLVPNRRLVDSVAEAAGVIAGEIAQDGQQTDANRRLVQRRLAALAGEVESAEALEDIPLLLRVVTGNLRLLAGMVRANHPWRLASRLSREVIGAVGVAAIAIVNADVWRIASRLGGPRLAAVCLAAIGGGVGALILAHRLWERAPHHRARQQAMLFNVVTLITVGFGILTLYLAVCLLSLGAAGLMIEPSLMSEGIGHRSDFADYVRLALLAGALATIGGALGGLLESDVAVRSATYAYRHQHD
jgi:uncharacterized membrane protein